MTDWTAETWAALGAWATTLVAVLAGVAAVLQVRELRRTRDEESQPYVVVYMEPSGATPQIIDLVVKNYGKTSAYDVTVSFEPALQRSVQGGQVEDVTVFDRLPVLVPRQEWRTLWDFAPNRVKSSLPLRYEVGVRYSSSKGRLPELRFVLDWTAHLGRRWVTEYGVHDAAKALREIQRTLEKWQERIHGGLSVVVRDGDKKDVEHAAEVAEFIAESSARRDESAVPEADGEVGSPEIRPAAAGDPPPKNDPDENG